MTNHKDEIVDIQRKLQEKNDTVKKLNKDLLQEMSDKLTGGSGINITQIEANLEKSNQELGALSKELLEKLKSAISSDLSPDEIKQYQSIIEAARDLSDGTYTGTAPPSKIRK